MSDLHHHLRYRNVFDLSPAERAKRYRELAQDALRLAEESKERAARQSYTLIAEQWHKRADAIERNALKYGTPYARSRMPFEKSPLA